MTVNCLSEALREAIDEVLEKMFFTEGEGDPDTGRPPEELVCVRVDFAGAPTGTMVLRITMEAARGMAADFLGEEACDVPPQRAREVACELANMICGSVLSRVESESTFQLSAPAAVVEVGDVCREYEGRVARHLALANGALSVQIGCEGSWA
jgi:CheY-specific phosphatase CheX